MKLSIVSGTYNRLPLLHSMVDSVRRNIPFGIDYEIVIVDGGSTDGTIHWCQGEFDIRLIQHGELRGAIKAFTEGAYAATGDYVILANDDIMFLTGSIMRALVHMENNPQCGALAFADNRPIQNAGREIYKVQVQPGIAPDGRSVNVAYAQVGMFRKWLGDKIGWWLGTNNEMAEARTYGGDNFLSTRIWELGYTVDDLPKLIRVEDHVHDDDLRSQNTAANDRAYWGLFPQGPKISGKPLIENPQRQQLRVLYLPIYEPGNIVQRYTKTGLRDALMRRGALVWEVDYLNSNFNIAEITQIFQPHLVLTQYHDGRFVDQLELIKANAQKAKVINWNGDARGLSTPEYMRLLRLVDLQLVVNAFVLPEYKLNGIKAAYWQIGYEYPDREIPEMPSFDVLFQGNCYSQERVALGEALREVCQANGFTLGLFGQGWPDSQGDTLYDFAAGEGLIRAAKIVVGDTFPGTEAFVSNRFIQTLGGGGFLLNQTIPNFHKFTPFRNKHHYVVWKNLEELKALIVEWLPKVTERAAIASAGKALVHSQYTFDALLNQLFDELLKGQSV